MAFYGLRNASLGIVTTLLSFLLAACGPSPDQLTRPTSHPRENLALPAPATVASDALEWQHYVELSQNSPARGTGLTLREQFEIFQSVVNHPVTSLVSLAKYDPTGAIGFCFGRAMAVHLASRKRGVAAEDVRKLFIVGDLRSTPAPEWRFHVTTLVRDEAGEWRAIDPILAQPLPAHEWVSQVRAVWDKNRKAKLYLTSADAILPDLSVFRPLNEEKGDRIIELAFDPRGRSGFTPEERLGEDVFTLSAEAERSFFTRAAGEAGTRFHFKDISINDGTLSYNGYFVDLLTDLRQTAVQGD